MGNRHYRLLAGPLLYFCLGCFWISGRFTTALQTERGWTLHQVALRFPLAVSMLALGAITGGMLHDRFGPALVGQAGALLFGLGFVGASFASNLVWHHFTLAILIGLGSGFAYSAGVPLVARWFPDKLGLAIGTAVAGYAFASRLGPTATDLIELTGWRSAAQLTGAALFLVTLAAIRILGAVPPAADPSAAQPIFVSSGDGGPTQMVRSRSFPSLWLSYALTSMAATMISSILPAHLFDLVSHQGHAAASRAMVLTSWVGTIANAGARVTAGWLCDRVDAFKTLWVAVALVPFAGFLAPAAWPPHTLLALQFAVLAGYGALLAIYPVLTAKLFGLRDLGANYGIVFSAWAGGYVVGSWFGSKLVRTFDAYAAGFYGAAVISLLGFWAAVRSASLARDVH